MLDRINTAFTKTPRLLCFILGGLTSLAFAPTYLIPLAALGFSVFLYLLSKNLVIESPSKLGWWFGFGHFVVGLYWLGNAIQTVGLWYLMPLGWFGLPAFLALFPATATWLSLKGTVKSPLLIAIKFSVFWFIAEWLRGNI